MMGFGVDYKFTKSTAAVLEYNYYGSSEHSKQQKLELGLKYSF